MMRDPKNRVDESSWTTEWSLAEEPRERRHVRNRLIVLAAAMPIVQLLRWLFS